MTFGSGSFNTSSIFAKIAMIVIGAIILVSGTLEVMSGMNMRDLATQFVAERGEAQAETASANLYGASRFGDSEAATAILDHLLEYSNGLGVGAAVIAPDGTVIATAESDAGDVPDLTAQAQAQLDQALVETVFVGDMIFHPIFKSPATRAAGEAAVGVLALDWRPDVAVTKTNQLERGAIRIAAGVALIVVVLSLLLSNYLLVKPLKTLRGSIDRIGGGELDTAVEDADRKDEIGAISRAVEDLRTTLRSAEEVQREAILKGAAFTAASAAMMMTDTDYRIRYVNPAIVELLQTYTDHIPALRSGFKMADLIGMSVDDFHSNGGSIRKRLQNLGHSTFKTTVAFGGGRVSLSISAAIDGDGNAIGLIMEWADVTQQWMNDAILHAIDSYQMRADFDIEGRLLSANETFCNSIGDDIEHLRGRTLADLIGQAGEEAPQGRDMMSTALNETAFAKPMWLSAKNGATIIVDGSFSCVRDNANKPILFMMLGRDVTASENDLREARAARKIDEREQTRVVDALRIGLRKLSEGDLTASIDDPFAGNYEDLRVDYNATVKTLADALREILENAENISNEARDISSTAEGLSRRTESTAATLEQTAAALNELTSSVQAAANGALDADSAVRDAKNNAEESGQVVLETVSAMDQIADSSGRITSIIKVIDDIAFQTNLLALNAGVEAARAGDAGRGFAVVASEVRALAQRSSDAAREINDLIAKSGNQVKRGVDLVGRTGSALQQIVESVSRISGLVSNIADSSQQQSLNLADINNSVAQLDHSTQQNAARLEETTAASESLRKDAVALVGTVSHFKISQTSLRGQDSGVVPFRARPRPSADRAEEPAVGRRRESAMAMPSATAGGWEDF